MKKEENFLRTLGEGVLTVIPLIGYHRGHSEGIKEGAARIGECYEKKYNLLISKGSDYHGPRVTPEIELGRGKQDNILSQKEAEFYEILKNYKRVP